MIEIRHLRYFIAVAEELNFSRAAERLHMAQPPLSAAIRQLEQELGARLLTRTTREVKLTPAGGTFLAGARRTLAELEGSVSSARRAAAGEVGQLHVAFSWGARFVTLPALGRAFRDSHPDVELLTEEMWNSRMAGALRSGAIDLAISLCPEIESGLAYQTIRSERVLALVASEHPLGRESEILLAALTGEPLVLFPRGIAPRLHESILGIARRGGFEPTIVKDSFHTGWELGILADVPAVAIVPESVGLKAPVNLSAIRLQDAEQLLETALVWRPEDESEVCAAFREIAGAVFGSPPAPAASPQRVSGEIA
ncbi:MAG: LysR family transcriptional regulator [Solirubrobacterales bacterium]|nr:LysR family transcriptional regulator [Solirubrobacterales bacterium]